MSDGGGDRNVNWIDDGEFDLTWPEPFIANRFRMRDEETDDALLAELAALRERVKALEDAAGRAGMALWNWHTAGDDEAKLWAAIEERDYVLYTLYPRLGVERRRVFDEE